MFVHAGTFLGTVALQPYNALHHSMLWKLTTLRLCWCADISAWWALSVAASSNSYQCPWSSSSSTHHPLLIDENISPSGGFTFSETSLFSFPANAVLLLGSNRGWSAELSFNHQAVCPTCPGFKLRGGIGAQSKSHAYHPCLRRGFGLVFLLHCSFGAA